MRFVYNNRNTSQGWWGRWEKISLQGGRKGGWPGLETGTYSVLGEGPQLSLLRQVNLSVAIDRLGRLGNNCGKMI